MPAAASDVNAATAIIARTNIGRAIVVRAIIARSAPKTATTGHDNREQPKRPLQRFKRLFLHRFPHKRRSRFRFNQVYALMSVTAVVAVTTMVVATMIMVAASPAPKAATTADDDGEQQKRPLQYFKRFFIHEFLPPVYRLLISLTIKCQAAPLY